MAVRFRIPGPLRPLTAERAEVTVTSAPATVREALEALWSVHPGVRDRVVNERGEVRQHINIFVGVENIRWTGGLSTPVADGNEISIIPAVSGGLC